MSLMLLIAIGIGAIAGLLVLILGLKLHPFVSLLLVATAAALAAGVPVADLTQAIEDGMGKTLGHIAIIIALGAMIGRMVDISGGAEALANSLVSRFGDKRVPLALTIAAFGVGIPVFFEVGVIMLMPLVYGLARTRRLPLLSIALPMCATLLVVHAMLPPHPGAVAVAGQIGVEVGRILMFGLPITAVTSIVTYFIAKLLRRRTYPMSADIEAELHRSEVSIERGLLAKPVMLAPKMRSVGAEGTAQHTTQLPPVRLVVSLIALPIVMILMGTIASITLPEGLALRSVLVFLGIPYIALMITVLLCAFLLGVRRGAQMNTVTEVLGAAIPGIAMVVLVTGAGGAFAKILVTTGIGPALAGMLQSTGLPIVALGFLITMMLRAAQGPTTVALMTTAGIIAPSLAGAALNANQLALVALAMGAGGMAVSHVNDAGFWIVTRMIGLSVGDGLKTWTVVTTCSGITAFAAVVLLWNFV
jgi:GntP family gluconate:H+ symporter